MPGGDLATVLWLTAAAGFSLCTTAFGTYGRLYCSLAGAVVFLVWLWLPHLALLAGAQFAAEPGRADAGEDPGAVRPGRPRTAAAQGAPDGGARGMPWGDRRRTPIGWIRPAHRHKGVGGMHPPHPPRPNT